MVSGHVWPAGCQLDHPDLGHWVALHNDLTIWSRVLVKPVVAQLVIPCCLWNPKMHGYVRINLLLDPILSYINSHPCTLFNIHFVLSPHLLDLWCGLFPSVFQIKILCAFLVCATYPSIWSPWFLVKNVNTEVLMMIQTEWNFKCNGLSCRVWLKSSNLGLVPYGLTWWNLIRDGSLPSEYTKKIFQTSLHPKEFWRISTVGNHCFQWKSENIGRLAFTKSVAMQDTKIEVPTIAITLPLLWMPHALFIFLLLTLPSNDMSCWLNLLLTLPCNDMSWWLNLLLPLPSNMSCWLNTTMKRNVHCYSLPSVQHHKL
jgi:hypothetical protein